MKTISALRSLGTVGAMFFVTALAFSAVVDNPGAFTAAVQDGSSLKIGAKDPYKFGSSTSAAFGATVDGDGNITIPAGVLFTATVPAPIIGSVTAKLVLDADASGAIDPVAGTASLSLTGHVEISGSPLIPEKCRIPSTDIALDSTGGVAYDPATGLVTLVDNTLILPATADCGLLGGTADSTLGLPSASGQNTLTLVLKLAPALTGS